MGLVNDHVDWRDFVVAVLNIMFPLPENYLIVNTNVTATGERTGVEGKWLRIVSREGFCFSGVEPER
jgi:hypothetical protein